MEEEKNEDNEYEMLVTRSGAYLRQSVDLQNETGKQRGKSSRKSPCILCKNHYSKANTWILDCNNCVDFIDFPCTPELPNGKLPTLQQTLADTLTCQDNDLGHKKKHTHNSSLDLMSHWIYCNIYTVSCVTVKKKLDERLVEYRALQKYDHKKRGHKYWERVETFNQDVQINY